MFKLIDFFVDYLDYRLRKWEAKLQEPHLARQAKTCPDKVDPQGTSL